MLRTGRPVCLDFDPQTKEVNDIKKGFFSGFENRFCTGLRSSRLSTSEYNGSSVRADFFFFNHFSLQGRGQSSFKALASNQSLYSFHLADHSLDDSRNSHRAERDLFL